MPLYIELTLVVLLAVAGGIAVSLLIAKHLRRHPEHKHYLAPYAPYNPPPVDKHVNDYGFILFAGGLLITGIGAVLQLTSLLDDRVDFPGMACIGGVLLMVIACGIRAFAAWGWSAGIIISLLLLLFPPLGTLFGIYGLWVLLRRSVRERFMVPSWQENLRRIMARRNLVFALLLLCMGAVWSTRIGLELRNALGLLHGRTSFLAEPGMAVAPVTYDAERAAVLFVRDGRELVLQDSTSRAATGIVLANCDGRFSLAGTPILVDDGDNFGIVWSECGGITFHKFDRDGRLIYRMVDPDAGHAHANALLSARTGILCISNLEPDIHTTESAMHLYDWKTGERLRVVPAGGSIMALSRDEETLYVAGWLSCKAIPLR